MHNSTELDGLSSDAIPKITAWAQKYTSIRAVLLTSTRAIPGAIIDVLSDYDVILVVEAVQPWVQDRAWLEDFGEVLVAYWDTVQPDAYFGVDVCANVIQYSDGLKIDFTLWPVGMLHKIMQSCVLPKELDAGYMVLVDKDHLTDGMPAPTGKAYAATPPTLEEYQLLIDDFLSDAPYVAKCLWRDELMPAKWCLDYDMKHVYLRPMLEWLVELDHNWELPVGYLGKGLKKYVSPDIWAELEQTYAGAQIEDNWEALQHTMELFHRGTKIVGASLGFPYPDELYEDVHQYVMRIRQMHE